MPSARIAPSTPMVEIIYRVQDIPESTVFNVDIGRMRVSNAELEEEENYLHNFASRVAKGLRCLCGQAVAVA
jgi:hypothetical protein